MAGSVMAAVKAALVTQLAALPSLAGVQVTYADPGEVARKENIWFGRVRDNDHEPVALKAGRRRREENFTLDCMVEVGGTRLSPQASEERAIALGTAIEEHLADYPKLQDAVDGVAFCVISGMELFTDQTTNGPRTVLTINIDVKARLL